MITSLDQLDLSKTYSYADYLSWKFEDFVELLKGKIMPMSAPNRLHQKISLNLGAKWLFFFNNNACGCEVYVAPFDVRLLKNPAGKTDKEIYTVVQPDICIICDLSKLDDRGCIGAPDLIVEIVSPGNSKRDVHDKFYLYQESGVKEYWVLRPNEMNIHQFYLENDRYVLRGIYSEEQAIRPVIFPELEIPLKEILY
jgi:Uma2 family endonuclease